jgi:hypothetical protein
MNLTKKSRITETLPKMAPKKQLPVSIAAALLALGAGSANADIVHLDDVIIDGSLCVGFDCVNGEVFGFDTIRMKENNLRLNAEDTSNSASFPTRDWTLIFNDTSNGGLTRFSIQDDDAGRLPFTIEGNAPSNSLYVEDGGRIGFGTSTPVVELHVTDGDTPTLRLEQDGSSGFTPQTWDLAGNETNFFVRDVTNGSRLPFRIRPNAPTSSIDVEGTTGDVGIGTGSPNAALHVRRTAGNSGIAPLLNVENNGALQVALTDTSTPNGATWAMQNSNGTFTNNRIGSGITEFRIFNNGRVQMGVGASTTAFDLLPSGDLTIAGGLTTAASSYPDYVFKPNYQLRSLDELAGFIEENGHLPNVPSEEDVAAHGGINISELQVALLEKVEELTLYTLEQHQKITELQNRLSALEPKAQ